MPERQFDETECSAGRPATGARALRSLAAADAASRPRRLLDRGRPRARCRRRPRRAQRRSPSAIRAFPTATRMNGTGGAPWSYAVHGTDVSKYQTSVDWHKAKASGVSFAFIKATEGGDRIDDYFDEHWSRTKAAGVPRAPIISTISAAPPPSRPPGTSGTCRTTAPPCRRCSTWNGTRDSPTCKMRPDCRDRAQRDEDLPVDRRKALRQEADHLHLGRFLRRQRPLRASAAIPTGCARSPAIPTANTAAIPSPSGNTPAPASFPASGQRRHQRLQRQHGRLEEVAEGEYG